MERLGPRSQRHVAIQLPAKRRGCQGHTENEEEKGVRERSGLHGDQRSKQSQDWCQHPQHNPALTVSVKAKCWHYYSHIK